MTSRAIWALFMTHSAAALRLRFKLRRCGRLRDWAWKVRSARGREARPASCPAAHPAVAAHRARASVAALQVADFPEDARAAARLAYPASAAEFREARSGSASHLRVECDNDADAAMFPRKISRAAETCCCGSCPPRDSRVRSCRRCSPLAIRRARDVRSPPRAATALAGLP